LVKQIRNGVLVGLFASLCLLTLVFLDHAWTDSAIRNLHQGETPYFDRMNRLLYDLFFAWRGSSQSMMLRQNSYEKDHPEKTILIFYIDKLTLIYAKRHYHEDFPWPRLRYVRLLEDLRQAGARAIALDILFPNERKGDNLLLKALQESHAVLASRYVYGENTLQNYEPPVFYKEPGVRYGFVDMKPDLDRIVRQTIFNLATPYSRNPWSLDATLLHYGMGKPIALDGDSISFENTTFPVTRGTLNARKPSAPLGAFSSDDVLPVNPIFLDINYTSPNRFINFPLYSLWDNNRIERLREVKDKIVLIGSKASEGIEIFGGDVFATPIGEMNGVEIHAHALETLLMHQPIIDFPKNRLLFVFLILSLGVFFGAVIPLIKSGPQLALGTMSIAGELLLAYALFFYHSIRLPLAPVLAASVFDFSFVSFYFYALARREVTQVRRLFEGYLSPNVVTTLLEEQNLKKIKKQLAGDKETVTILYTDIRGFTTLSESLPPEEVVKLLNEYLPPMSSIVYRFGGYLDKFIGDAILAVFSAPFPQADDPWRAVQAAHAMQKEMTKLSEIWEKQNRLSFQVGIGINTGEVVLGNVGSQYKKDYTVIGDTVNVAARLCGLAKGGEILLSEATYEQVKDHVEVKPLGPLSVKGRNVPVLTFLLLGVREM